MPRPKSNDAALPPPFHPSRSPIEGFITFRVSRLRKLMDRYSASSLGERFGLNLAEWRVLTTLHAASPASVKWLCAQLQADKAEISRACAALVERGAVRRDVAGGVAFSITPAGQVLHDDVLPSRQEIQTELAAVMTGGELSALYSALKKLTEYLTLKARSTAMRRPRREQAPGRRPSRPGSPGGGEG